MRCRPARRNRSASSVYCRRISRPHSRLSSDALAGAAGAPFQAVQPSCMEESREGSLRKACVHTRGPFSGGRSRTAHFSEPLAQAYSLDRLLPAGQGFGTTSGVSRKGRSCFACAPNVFRNGIFPETTGPALIPLRARGQPAFRATPAGGSQPAAASAQALAHATAPPAYYRTTPCEAFTAALCRL